MLMMSLRGRSWIGFNQARWAFAPLGAKYLCYREPNGCSFARRHANRMSSRESSSGNVKAINIALLAGRLCFCAWRANLSSLSNKEIILAETDKGPTVADIFRRAQAIRSENGQASYKELAGQLVREYSGSPFPPTYNLTIPEQDSRAPEEDWTAGLPLVLRGIQQKDWNDIGQGIVLSLEQTENYERESGPEGNRDDWHDRSKGIRDAVEKGVGKWMPEELVKMAARQMKNRS